MKFEIGDYVKSLVDHPDDNRDILVDDAGTVCGFDSFGRVGVRWDKRITYGHHCHGHCENGYGWYVEPEDICLYEEAEEIDEASFLKIASA